jgi:hypothetical protein
MNKNYVQSFRDEKYCINWIVGDLYYCVDATDIYGPISHRIWKVVNIIPEVDTCLNQSYCIRLESVLMLAPGQHDTDHNSLRSDITKIKVRSGQDWRHVDVLDIAMLVNKINIFLIELVKVQE